jgi:hypothetical protein
VTYCLISITGDISQKAEQSSVEEQHFDEYLLTVTNKQILLSACVIIGRISQKAAYPSLTVFSCKCKNSHLVLKQNLIFLVHADQKSGVQRRKAAKKSARWLLRQRLKGPDRAFFYPEMVMQYINS